MKRATIRILAASLAALLGAGVERGALSAPACDMRVAFGHPIEGGSRTVRSSADGAMLYVGPLQINYDGAPNAYHPLGRRLGGALDTICNGADAILPSGEKISGATDCDRFWDAFVEARDSDWTAPGKPRIEWYGVASVGAAAPDKWRPCVQANGPHAGFFVAQTALAADPTQSRCGTARYLDSTRLPFFVLPRRSAFQERGMELADVGIALYSESGLMVPAIVGDVGPARKLGEGSLALARSLRGEGSAQSATIRDFQRAAIADGVYILMFPDSRVEPPITAERIAAVANSRFAAWGGADRLRSCAQD